MSKAPQPVDSRPRLLERIVSACAGSAALVVLLAVLGTGVMVAFITRHFAMTTDTYALLSPKLPWRERETAFNLDFYQDGSNIVAVIDGKTPELSDAAAARLAEVLGSETRLFHSISRPDAGPFWDRNRLLYATLDDVRAATAQLVKAQAFLGPLSSDPSLRGIADTLLLSLRGIEDGRASLEDLRAPITSLADTLQRSAAGQPTFFSWSALISDSKPDQRQLRRLLLIDPILDFAELQPGKAPIEAIRAAASSLHIDEAHGVRMRLTGPVPLQDEELATLTQRAGLIALLASAAIILMLWLAVRSVWLIVSIIATTLVGLVMATALGLLVFGRFNVISVAFIPLFVGLGIDLGIQFSVRYRESRQSTATVNQALDLSARVMGSSLALAACAIAAGFLAFGPTDYDGVSQLGIIAGFGMFIALALNLTLLPSLIALTRPPGAPRKSAPARLSQIDRLVLRHRRLVLGLGIGSAIVCAALLPILQFDFNPLRLRSPTVESVATLLDLMNDPEQSPNTLEIVRPNLAAADRLADVFKKSPVVSSVHTLSSLIPADQDDKRALISDAANLLDLTLNPVSTAPPPDDAQTVASLNRVADKLRHAPTPNDSMRAEAARLADEFGALAKSSPSARSAAAGALLPGLGVLLAQIRNLLSPEVIDLEMLPADMKRLWLTADGRARVSVTPKGDSNDDAVLDKFIKAGLAIAPDVTGTAISLQASGKAVVNAFVEAGILSFIAITALLLIALRRVRDVAITMAPIVLTGLLTMGTCVLIGQPLNFANIIALPLLFGIGVAFHIYFVMSWRSGGSHLLTSSLARAVFFSAMATATGFGSLWASSHPGTASMGKLLMISLLWTLVSALVFQPALMGAPPVEEP